MSNDFNSYIDYTLLKPDAKEGDIINLCNIAKEKGYKSVCVNPSRVSLAKDLLKESCVKVCTVVGFPLGATYKEVKALEAEHAIRCGAEEIDMVINIGALKDGNYGLVQEDIEEVFNVCKSNNALLKVIIETCLLTDSEKETISDIIVKVGADFIKTSTGFSTSGATEEDIKLIKKVAGNRAKIKASGGIKDYKSAMSMINAGAERIGTSRVLESESL